MSAKWRAWVSAALACSAVAVYPTTEQLAATRQQASPSPQPWLGTSVDLVLVDLRVTRDGEAVSDVRQDELTLFVDGTPRPLVSLVYAPVTRPPQLEGGPGEPSTAPAEATGGHGETLAGRQFVIVVDRESLDAAEARSLRNPVERFIEQLPPGVALAVTTLPLTSGIRFDPDRDAVIRSLRLALQGTIKRGAGLEALAGFGCTGDAASAGCGAQGLDPAIGVARARETNLAAEWTQRGRRVLTDLQWLFRAVSNGAADVVIISGALPFQESLTAGLRADIERTFIAARTTGVRVHAIESQRIARAQLPEGGDAPTLNMGSLRAKHPAGYGLPEETGGVHASGSVSSADFFKQLSRQLASTYLLSFEPVEADRNGKPHRIDVRSSRRPALTIHARKTFIIPTRPPNSSDSLRVESPSPTAVDVPVSDAGGTSPTTVVPIDTMMERASTYVEMFERTLSSFVAEERYVQVLRTWRGTSPIPGMAPELRWREDGDSRTEEPADSRRRRQLLSDVLLVQPPGQPWIAYRDVAEVDGKPVRDRARRVESLFLAATTDARAQLDRIASESARYNHGSGRNINLPTFPLQLLRPVNLSRFEWTPHAQPRSPTDPASCTVVGFRETSTPTLVRTDAGRNVPMTGAFCIEPDTGRVWRATLRFRERREKVHGAFEVTFQAAADADALLPERAWEWSVTKEIDEQGAGLMVEGQATYGRFRRFMVRTQEQVK